MTKFLTNLDEQASNHLTVKKRLIYSVKASGQWLVRLISIHQILYIMATQLE